MGLVSSSYYWHTHIFHLIKGQEIAYLVIEMLWKDRCVELVLSNLMNKKRARCSRPKAVT